MTTNNTTGESIKRKEDLRFITGAGRYTDDVSLARQTYAYFVRSPYAHARILSVDTNGALQSPGVITVLTGQDYTDAGLGMLGCGWMIHSKDGTPMKMGERPALARDRVRYVGDHVAVVIAETRQQAKDGAEKVLVDYDDLPAVVDVSMAQAVDAPQLHDIASNNTIFAWELGDVEAVDKAFEQAAHKVSLDFTNNRLIPNAMEPRATNATYEPSTERLTVYLSSQNPHGMRMMLSAAIGLAPEHKLRVISEDVGGGFGSKAFNYPEEIVCAWAAKTLARPVKWTAERSEAFMGDAHGRDHATHVELALGADHKFLGVRVKNMANLGAYMSTFASLIPTYVYAPMLSGQYRIPAIYAEVDAVYTNTAPVDAYRGAGRPEATYAIERIIDVAAYELNVDPVELRRKNFITDFPYQTPVEMEYDVGDYASSLDRALDMIDYDGFPKRREASETAGKKRGIGVATYIEASGIGPSAKLAKLGAGSGLWESAEIRVNPTGSVEVLTGCHSHGQSHETTYAQLVAQRFGIPVDQVELLHGDTDKVQFGMGTYGSRSGPVGMSAVALACDKVVVKARQIAGHLMAVPFSSVKFEEGIFSSEQTEQTLAFPEVAIAAYMAHSFPTTEIEPGLKEGCYFDPPNFSFPAGCYICEVEIDPETGITDIVDFIAVDDFGNIINPMVVDGQVHGGVAQGIGQALLEHAIYDKDSGQLLTGSYMDYCMPRADDLPVFRTDNTVTPSTTNPLGLKGCGEAGAIGAPPAVISAISNALGIAHIDMPATPERVWRAIQKGANAR